MSVPSTSASPRAARDRSPAPCVRLFAEHVAVTQAEGLSYEVEDVLVPLVALSFDYGGTRVGASDERTRVFRSDAGALEAVDRDRGAEHDARRVIERLGAVEIACLDAVAPPDGCEADYVVRADGDTHSFCAFTERALATWASLGWRVEVDAAYPFRVVASEPLWYARVEPAAAPGDEPLDWFGLELGVDVDGARVDLLPVLLDMLERLDADGGLDGLATSCRPTWALRVSETHHVNVPLDRLRALLRVVAELYQGDRRGLRAFPEVRAGALVELDSAFQRAGA
ncbi:MAG: hypothetical protein ACRELB_01470, partial [Polyangiaceae bacterium]